MPDFTQKPPAGSPGARLLRDPDHFGNTPLNAQEHSPDGERHGKVVDQPQRPKEREDAIQDHVLIPSSPWPISNFPLLFFPQAGEFEDFFYPVRSS